MTLFCFSESFLPFGSQARTSWKWRLSTRVMSTCREEKSSMTLAWRAAISVSERERTRSMILLIRDSLAGMNGRSNTREGSGEMTIELRLMRRAIVFPCLFGLGRREVFERIDRIGHFGQRKAKGQRRFSALVLVQPVDVQRIAASACLRVVDR